MPPASTELYTEQKAVLVNTSPKPMNPFGA
jgi:hypothetical protein